jgi:Icc protein
MAAASIHVLHVSDLHCAADPVRRVYGELSEQNLDAVISKSMRHDGPPDVIIATGDIADDSSSAAYTRVAERLRSLAPDAFWVPGNHDKAVLMAGLAPGAFPASVSIGDWELVFLDSAWADHNQGRLGPGQLSWLTAHLLDLRHHIAVVLHHPPLPACDAPECQLSDANELLDVLDRHPRVRVVLTGHNHRPFEQLRGSIEFLGAPSTCRQAHHEAPKHAWTNEGPAARSITLLSDGTVQHHVTWLSEPPATPELSWVGVTT